MNFLQVEAYECSTPDCNNSTEVPSILSGSSAVWTGPKFTPKCENIFIERCYVKLVVTPNKDGYCGIIAVAYTKDVELQPNILHSGLFEKEKVYHYVINKSHMEVFIKLFRIRPHKSFEFT